MIYLGITIAVVIYLLGYWQGHSTAVAEVESMLRRIDKAHRNEVLKNLYPDKK